MLVIAYRENNLYSDFIPKVSEILKNDGVEIKEISYPAGTDPEIIGYKLHENLTSIPNSAILIIADNTCKVALESHLQEISEQEQGIFKSKVRTDHVTLDDFFGTVFISSLANSAINLGVAGRIIAVDLFFNAFYEFLRIIKLPYKTVYVIKDELAAHLYEMRGKEEGMAQKISLSFQEIVPRIKINIVEKFHNISTEDLSNLDTLVVFDRHCDPAVNFFNRDRDSCGLGLPLESCMHDYQMKNLTTNMVKPEHIASVLKVMIE
ncbi:MAG: hypothetical protein WD552_01730 [Candidatus Paceibacterota bacterium]